jgi:hypothetical protein
VVPVVPVPQPVVDDPEGGGLVVALAELVQHVRVRGCTAAGTGVLDGLIGLAEDRDDVTSPGLQAAEADGTALSRTFSGVSSAARGFGAER